MLQNPKVVCLGGGHGLAATLSAMRNVTKNVTAVVTVADNGDGIPEASQKQLFELLSSSKSSGMGLGLWLCKHIVTRHGGSIVFEPNPGGGAKFLVRFPVDSEVT